MAAFLIGVGDNLVSTADDLIPAALHQIVKRLNHLLLIQLHIDQPLYLSVFDADYIGRQNPDRPPVLQGISVLPDKGCIPRQQRLKPGRTGAGRR